MRYTPHLLTSLRCFHSARDGVVREQPRDHRGTKVIAELKQHRELGRRCRCRPVRYLNNIVEQDHRAIKRRVRASQGFTITPGSAANDSRESKP